MAELLQGDAIDPGLPERDEGVVHVGLGKKYEADLATGSWPAENTVEMGTLVEALGSSGAKQAEAKEIIGKVRLGASIVLEKTTV